MTDRLITRMVKWEIINEKEIEIYRFGLETLFLKIFHYISYLLIAILSGKLVNYLFFFIAFFFLRKNAGGYHSETKLNCYFWSCLTVISVIFIMKYSILHNVLTVIATFCLIISDITICLLAPMENANRRLEIEEAIYFRKRTILVLLAENILIFLFIAMHREQYALPIILAIVCSAILLLLQKIKDYIQKALN